MSSLPLTATHGGLAGRGDGGIASDSDDDAAASSGGLPSFAPSNASGMPGDLDDCDEHDDSVLRPRWDDDTMCSEGVWKVQTRGGGDADAEKDDKGSGLAGTYGVLSANWGGNWSDKGLQAHMLKDIKSSPSQVLCLQEATESLRFELEKTPDADAQRAIRGGGDGNEGVQGERQPGKFIGVRGTEPKTSLMIAGRVSLVTGIRLLVLHRLFDGQYRAPGKKGKAAQVKGAVSRILIASLKMRYFRTRGGGDEAEGLDEITIANVHMHFRTAKRDLTGGAKAYKQFWDVLARYLAEFCPSFLCGDFNMALFCVVPELRARGFQINLAAWYCWQNHLEQHPRADSCGIFRLGPCQGIRMCFGASVFGLASPPLPANCSMVMEILRDADGKEIEQRQYAVPKLEIMGQGYALTSYRPLETKRREQFVKWTMTPAFDALSPAVAGIIECTKSDKAMFPYKADTTIGSESWTWPEGPMSKQKLASYERFDPDKELFKRGAHMPLMIYIGSSKDTRRTPKSLAKRAENAARRGWTYDRIQKHKAGIETSGGGKHSKGKGKHKGKGVHTHGHGEPSDGQRLAER